MAFEELIKQLAQTLQNEASVRAVFGEPIKLDTHIVVPVATVAVNISGGGTGASRKPAPETRDFFAGGGGINVFAKPVGFIHEQDGKAVFAAIAPPVKETELPPIARKIIEAVTPAKH